MLHYSTIFLMILSYHCIASWGTRERCTDLKDYKTCYYCERIPDVTCENIDDPENNSLSLHFNCTWMEKCASQSVRYSSEGDDIKNITVNSYSIEMYKTLSNQSLITYKIMSWNNSITVNVYSSCSGYCILYDYLEADWKSLDQLYSDVKWFQAYMKYTDIIVTTFLAIAFFIHLLACGYVFLIFFKYGESRNLFHYLFLNIAICDFLGTFFTFMIKFFIWKEVRTAHDMRNCYVAFQGLIIATNIYSMFALSISQYTGVIKTNSRCAFIMILPWVPPIIILLVSMDVFQYHDMTRNTNRTTVYLFRLLIFGVLVPTVLTFLFLNDRRIKEYSVDDLHPLCDEDAARANCPNEEIPSKERTCLKYVNTRDHVATAAELLSSQKNVNSTEDDERPSERLHTSFSFKNAKEDAQEETLQKDIHTVDCAGKSTQQNVIASETRISGVNDFSDSEHSTNELEEKARSDIMYDSSNSIQNDSNIGIQENIIKDALKTHVRDANYPKGDTEVENSSNYTNQKTVLEEIEKTVEETSCQDQKQKVCTSAEEKRKNLRLHCVVFYVTHCPLLIWFLYYLLSVAR